MVHVQMTWFYCHCCFSIKSNPSNSKIVWSVPMVLSHPKTAQHGKIDSFLCLCDSNISLDDGDTLLASTDL